MRLLITGGCGFLGSNLAADALLRSDDLLVFDNLHRNGSQENLNWLRSQGDFQFVHGDIRNQNDISRVILEFKPNAIFHLAGQVAMTTSIANLRMDFEVNALGTVNLLEAVRLYCPDSIVLYSSTNKVYGDLEQYSYDESESRFRCIDMPMGFNENVQLEFHSPYGCSKGAADQYMLDYARIFGLKTAVFRHSSMYGSRQFATCDQGWVGWFCQQGVEAKSSAVTLPFEISGSGKQVRDLLHASDVSHLYHLATLNIEKISGQAFNVGGGFDNSMSLLELFEFIEQHLDTRLKYIKKSARESDQRVFIADNTKINQFIDWRPTVTKEVGIKKMLDWVGSYK